ncbi:MAG TPA: SpoIIE family protein phosphatase [Thermoanaerobaculia bacterium]
MHPFPRRLIRSLAVGVALGLLFASFYAIAQPERAPSILTGGAVTGVCISIAISLLETLFAARIERLPHGWRMPAKGLEYLIGSLLGWVVGMNISYEAFGFGIPFRALVRGNWIMSGAVTGAVTVVVGLSFYAYEVLQRRLARTIEQLKEREWAEKELELARAIQTRLLPPSLIDGDGYTIAARVLPARFVAGDFYDVVPLDDGSVAIIVADVAGKGVGASLIMASVKAVLPFVAREGAQRALSMLNTKLIQELGRREFVALVFARYYPADGRLEVANAGFPEPYVVSRDGVTVLSTSGEKFPLGLKAGIEYEPVRTRIAPGERVVFVSDGIPEAPADGSPLGYDRVAAILGASDATVRGAEWLDAFVGDVRCIVDEGLADDWTAVVLHRA